MDYVKEMQNKDKKEKRLNIWVSTSLKIGVYVSIVMVVIGLILTGFGNQNIGDLVPLTQLPSALLHLNAAAVITLAVLILLLTPVSQIVVAMVVMLLEKDKIYSGICLLLLCILAISIVVSFV
jgi:uncharacterized membrane protein